MSKKPRARLGLPLLLGALTFTFLLLALWPQETPTATLVIAARDLGAGSVLSTADLTRTIIAADQVPADALSDPDQLVGETLAVVRFQGEPVTTRHLGPAVAVGPRERAVSLRVRQDQGLAGVLRPGMRVGVVATLPTADGHMFAKAMLEDLRVVYVSPDFQARPETPLSGEMTVASGQPAAVRTSGSAALAREGIVLLAAAVDPQPLTYAPISETLPLTYTLAGGQDAATGNGLALAVWQPPQAAPDMLNALITWVTPVELLAALNAQDQAFTLVLMPEAPEPYVSPGFDLTALIPAPQYPPEYLP